MLSLTGTATARPTIEYHSNFITMWRKSHDAAAQERIIAGVASNDHLALQGDRHRRAHKRWSATLRGESPMLYARRNSSTYIATMSIPATDEPTGHIRVERGQATDTGMSSSTVAIDMANTSCELRRAGRRARMSPPHIIAVESHNNVAGRGGLPLKMVMRNW